VVLPELAHVCANDTGAAKQFQLHCSLLSSWRVKLLRCRILLCAGCMAAVRILLQWPAVLIYEPHLVQPM